MASLDRVIVAEYAKFRVPADQIVSDPDLSADFHKVVNNALPPDDHVEVAALNKRLLNLRRKGEENGGLPRLRRSYNGRGNTKPR